MEFMNDDVVVPMLLPGPYSWRVVYHKRFALSILALLSVAYVDHLVVGSGFGWIRDHAALTLFSDHFKLACERACERCRPGVRSGRG